MKFWLIGISTLISTYQSTLAPSRKTVKHQFLIAEGLVNPDGRMPMPGITINGQFPGPPIEAEMGDRIQVRVRNGLTRGFSMHWHGMRQFGTLRSDGVPGVTQKVIPPGGEYLYDFEAGDQMGTWWYHAHTGLDLIQAFGPLIIHETLAIRWDLVKFDKRFHYDSELTVMLSEWWHQSPAKLTAGLTSQPFTFPPRPDMILINGKPDPLFVVERGKRYRIRFIASNGGGSFSVHIPFHELDLIEADGTVLEPTRVRRIEIGPGQRYSAIITTNQLTANFGISVQSNGSTSTAKIRYFNAPLDFNFHLTLPQPEIPWKDAALYTSKWYSRNLIKHHRPPPLTIQREIVLNIKDVKDKGLPRFKINQILQPTQPTLKNLFNIKTGEGVQIILQHFASNATQCEPHPWHLHGNAFYVVGQGSGIFNPILHHSEIQARLQLSPKTPLLRDTLMTYPQNTIPQDRNCGWYAIRFLADNPGDWLFHCHITPHLIMGKYVVVHVG